MSNKEEESGGTNLVLPIVCSNCGKENNLSVAFELMPPEKTEE